MKHEAEKQADEWVAKLAVEMDVELVLATPVRRVDGQRDFVAAGECRFAVSRWRDASLFHRHPGEGREADSHLKCNTVS